MDLTQWMWLIWLAVALVCIIIELLTLEFTFAMVGIGAAVGGLGTSLLGWPWWVQVLAAAALSALLLFLIRPLLIRALRRGEDRTRHNVDAIAGQRGRVVEAFGEGGGVVLLGNGETWSARLAEDAPPTQLSVGDRVRVLRVVGATVEVSPEPMQQKEP